QDPRPERLALDAIGYVAVAETVQRLEDRAHFGRGNADLTGRNHQARVLFGLQLRHQFGRLIGSDAAVLHDQPMARAARLGVEGPGAPIGAAGQLAKVVSRPGRAEMAYD